MQFSSPPGEPANIKFTILCRRRKSPVTDILDRLRSASFMPVPDPLLSILKSKVYEGRRRVYFLPPCGTIQDPSIHPSKISSRTCNPDRPVRLPSAEVGCQRVLFGVVFWNEPVCLSLFVPGREWRITRRISNVGWRLPSPAFQPIQGTYSAR